MNFKKQRQRIIDEYLGASGKNLFVPAEFIDWLAERPKHEAYEWFFSTSDKEAARQHRISLARQMASGLRITARVSQAPGEASVVAVSVREFPALVSPMAGRKDGGGYQSFDPEEPALVSELSDQGAQALDSWLNRYRGVAELSGVDVAPIEEIVAQMRGSVAGAA